MVEMHEAAHQAIYRNYGIDSEKVNNLNPFTKEFYSYLKSFGSENAGYTVATSNETCSEICELAHSNNESYGYQMQNIVYAIFFAIFFFVMYRFFVTDDFEREVFNV